jgi:hypothetical protein
MPLPERWPLPELLGPRFANNASLALVFATGFALFDFEIAVSFF